MKSTIQTQAGGFLAFICGALLFEDQELGATPMATNLQLPAAFAANKGQCHPDVQFVCRGGGYTLFLTDSEAVVVFNQAPPMEVEPTASSETVKASTETVGGEALKIRFPHSNPHTKLVGEELLTGKQNYFRGNNPVEWQRDVPLYGKVRYRELYPGIDLVFYENERQLEFDFVVQPGADPKAIRLAFEGAEAVKLDAQGEARVCLSQREVVLREPRLHQKLNGRRQSVAGAFAMSNANEVVFEIADHAADLPLVIDPEIGFSTYLGGSAGDYATDVAIDKDGNIYVSGRTESPDYPPAGLFKPGGGGERDLFVSKLSPDGHLIYSTIVGGSGFDGPTRDRGAKVAVDEGGFASVVGTTESDDFPIRNAAQASHGGGYKESGGWLLEKTDGVVFRLNPEGNQMVFSTFLGGSFNEDANDIAVDSAGNVYVTGGTDSKDFPLVQAMDSRRPVDPNALDTFITKFAPSGAILYSTYLGAQRSQAYTIAVDGPGNAYVAGWCSASPANFPATPGAYQTKNLGEQVFGPDWWSKQGYVVRINSAGTGLSYATWFGTPKGSLGIQEIALDSEGNAYLVGEALDDLQVTPGAVLAQAPGFYSHFLAKLNATGSALVYATYIPAPDRTGGQQASIAVNRRGNAYVAGHTLSSTIPLVEPIQPAHGSPEFNLNLSDAYIMEFSDDGRKLLFSTYLGGSSHDQATAITVRDLDAPVADSQGETSEFVVVVGNTSSTNFPTVNPFQATRGGGTDAFVTRLGAVHVPEVQIGELVVAPGGFGQSGAASYRSANLPVTYRAFYTRTTAAGVQVRVEGPVLRQTSTDVTVRVPAGVLGTANDFLNDLNAGVRRSPTTLDITRGDTNLLVTTRALRLIFPTQLIHDQVDLAPAAAPQQVLPQFALANQWASRAFYDRGQSEDGPVAFRVWNMAPASPPPLSLKAMAWKLPDSPPPRDDPLNAGRIPNLGGTGIDGIRFDISADGIYILAAAQELLDQEPPFPDRFPAPIQVHLAGDVGLPRRIINGQIEPERATRQDVLFNHPAPRPGTLTRSGITPNWPDAPQTALFKFANVVSSRRIPTAVLMPPVGGFVPPARIIRAADPITPLDLTTPTAQSPGDTPTPVPGTILDFTQVPWPTNTAPGVPTVPGSLGAVLGTTFTYTNNGTLILDMGAGHEIVDGTGADFKVDASSGSYQIAVGNTPFNGSFRSLGTTFTGSQNLDLAGTGLRSARFVRVTGAPQVSLITVMGLNVFADSTLSQVGPIVKMPAAAILSRRLKAPDNMFDPFIELYGTDGERLDQSESGFGESLSDDLSDAVIPNRTLPSDGFYRFLVKGYDVRPDGQAFGSFNVRLETPGRSFDTADIPLSSQNELATAPQKEGSFAQIRQRDSYTFEAAPGQTLNVVVLPRGAPPYANPILEIYDPGEFLFGASSDFPESGRAVMSVTLPTTTQAGNSLAPSSTWRLVVSAVDEFVLTSREAFPQDGGMAYFRRPARGGYSLKVFAGAIRPTIVGVTPISGDVGKPVIITGRNFVPGAANTVRFGTSPALITSGTETEIVTAVPSGLAEGTVELTVETAGMRSPPAAFIILAPNASAPDVTDAQVSQFSKVDSSGGMATGPDRTVYVIGRDSGTLTAISPVGTKRTVAELGQEEGAWRGVVIDQAGNAYVSHFTGNEVLKVTPSGEKSTFASNISQPTGLTIDDHGSVYVSSFDTGKVYRLTPSHGAQGLRRASVALAATSMTEYASGLSQPDALSFNQQGELFVANRGNNQISKVPAGGGTAQTFVQLDQTPEALVCDSSGDLIVSTKSADGRESKLQKVSSDGQTVDLGGGFSSVSGLAVDAEGNWLVSDAGGGLVYKVSEEVAPARLPEITVAPTVLDFGNLAVNQARELEVSVRNEGEADLVVSSLTSSDTHFVVLTSAPLPVAPHSAKPVRIRFLPTSVGLLQATLSITSNDPDESLVEVTLRGTGTQGQSPALARFYCLSLRVPPTTGELGGQTYTVELTGGFEEDRINDELAPMFFVDDPMSQPDPGEFSHASEMRISVPGSPMPLARGALFANVPKPSDANGNGYPDFFEVNASVAPTTTDGLFMDFEETAVQLTWERPAGSSQGTVRVRMNPEGIGELAFEAGFELIEYAGTLVYTPGERQVTGTMQFRRSGDAARTLVGPVVLTKDPASPALLNLVEGVWTDQSGGEWTYDESPLERRSAGNYFGVVELVDGNLSTDLEDYFVWGMSVDDPNDTDGDGISNLLDDPAGLTPATQPTLSIALSGGTLSITIQGDQDKAFVLEQCDSLATAQWQEVRSGTLSKVPEVLSLPIPSGASKFYRVRMAN